MTVVGDESLRRLLRALGIVGLVCAGCGESLPLAPVSGMITYQGRPLVGATIATQPIGKESTTPGPGSFGKTDENGRYELELVKPALPGAIIGEHRVMITRAIQTASAKPSPPVGAGSAAADRPIDNSDADRQLDRKWPQQYSDGSLRLEVPPAGTSDAHFELK